MHFPEILVASAGNTPEILHSHENKGILTALVVTNEFQTKFAVQYLGLELAASSSCTESESPSHLENGCKTIADFLSAA